MKSFIFTSILGAFLAPAFALACGPSQEQIEQSLLKKLKGKTLECTTESGTYSAVLKIYAAYRCINSPVYGVLNLEDKQTKTIAQAVEDEMTGKVALRFAQPDEAAFCEVKE